MFESKKLRVQNNPEMDLILGLKIGPQAEE
jgi:hypothetical protein